MTGRLRRIVAVVGIGLVTSAAAGHAAVGGASGDFTGTVRLPNGRSMYLVCRGTGSPTVMLEGGLHSTADVWILPSDPGWTQETVLPALAKTTRVCAYDRPGTAIAPGMTSRSDPVRMPRNTGEIVKDLRALQRGQDPGPLRVRRALDGWPHRTPVHEPASRRGGGPRARRSHSREYGDRPVGLRLERLRPAAPRAADGARRLRRRRNRRLPPELRPDARRGREATGTHPDRRDHRGQSFGIPGAFGERLDAAWFAGQDHLAKLEPGTPHLVSKPSGHEIEFEDPAIVIDAAHRVIDAVRAGNRPRVAPRTRLRARRSTGGAPRTARAPTRRRSATSGARVVGMRVEPAQRQRAQPALLA